MNLKPIISKLSVLVITITFPYQIFAYVGPGAGITFLGALWAVITAILLAVGGFLFWPIRALLRRRKLGKQKNDSGNNTSPDDNKDLND